MYHLSIINSWKGEVPMKTLKRMLVTLAVMAMMVAGFSTLAFAAASPSVTNISKATVTLSATEFAYSGKTQSPSVTVKYAGQTLKQDTDYTVSVKSGSAVGSYTVNITGMGLFEGTVNKTYTIAKASLKNATATADTVYYTGKAQTAELTVTDANGNTLKQGTDYTVSDATYTDADTYTVKITGKGNYKGSTEASFRIGRSSIEKATIEVAKATYNGKSQTAKLTVTDVNGNAMKEGRDYTVENATQTKAGTYKVTVVAKGNYRSEQEVEFTIAKDSLSDATATADTVYYTGKAQTAELTVTDANSNTLKQGTDYTVSDATYTDADTYTVKITGKGNYKGSTEASFKIGRSSVAKATIEVAKATYNGKSQTAKLTVTDANGNAMKKGRDYTVENATKTKAGTYTVTVVGMGNYRAEQEVEFTIAKDSLSDATAVADTVYYTGKAQTAKLTVEDANGNTLKQGTDYTVSDATYTDADTYTVKITGKGNYKGSKEVSFRIGKSSIEKATIKVAKATYNGKSQTAKLTVTDVNGNAMKEGRDYTVENATQTKAGTYKVTVVAKGNYRSEQEVEFTIAKASVAKLDVTVGSATYTGKAQTAKITVKTAAGNTLTANTDYTVTNASKTAAGTYTVTISGKGNYSGSQKVNFTIKKAAQSVTASAKKNSFGVAALKKAAATTTITVSGVKGDAAVQYTSSNSKYVTVTKAGKVTLKKGTPKGTYKVTVSIGATTNYKATTKTISITVK
jgi:uncharacterized Zn ribbon protein